MAMDLKDYRVPGRPRGSKRSTACDHCDGPMDKASNARWCSDCAQTNYDRANIRKYGLSRSEREAMYFEQDGTCPLCLEREATHIDHSHDTGKVRQLVCNTCNIMLSYIEKPDWVGRANEYLKEWG